MKEVPQVKMIDKLSFTFGVLCIAGSEWLSLRHADWFPLYYSVIMSCLLLWRLITYTKDKYQLFMLGQITMFLTVLNLHNDLLPTRSIYVRNVLGRISIFPSHH